MVKILLAPAASRRTAERLGRDVEPLPDEPIELPAVPARGDYVAWNGDDGEACVELVLYRAGDPVVEVQVGV